jgi:aminoglycoside 6-adenylyltransferase
MRGSYIEVNDSKWQISIANELYNTQVMRSEEEILDLIMKIAGEDDAIRAVVMNGSRVNPDIAVDPFQDFDIRYYVTDIDRFRSNPEWARRFGEFMILQMPDGMFEEKAGQQPSFSYLMQFTDGNRIDLSIHPLSDLAKIMEDSLARLLLDKDGVVAALPTPSDKSYWPTPPSAKLFADTCNEFWWISIYVAKALWRGQIFFAKDLLDRPMRDQLMTTLTWYFGMQTGFRVNPGKWGANFKEHLHPDIIRQLEQTYAGVEADENWDALLVMCNLFRKVATEISEKYGFLYPTEEDKRVTAHLEKIRQLPPKTDT